MTWRGMDLRCFKYRDKNGPRCSHILIIAIVQFLVRISFFYNCCTLLQRCCEGLNRLSVRVTLH